MIVIADSGSTKTQWAFLSSLGTIQYHSTPGMNPLTSTAEDLRACIASASQIAAEQKPHNLYFYGAGCGTLEARQRISHLLCEAFPEAIVNVETDMLGACRALCGNTPGIVGILGTGSNACCYNGQEITACPPSLGYLLGDEGSGNHIGRCLLRDYLRGLLPAELSNSFSANFSISYDQTIHHLYNEPNANRFLASIAPFAAVHRDHPYIQQMLSTVFNLFVESQLLPLSIHGPQKLFLMGSVAFAFREDLERCILSNGLKIGEIVKDPIEGLIRFHLR